MSATSLACASLYAFIARVPALSVAIVTAPDFTASVSNRAVPSTLRIYRWRGVGMVDERILVISNVPKPNNVSLSIERIWSAEASVFALDIR